MVAAAMIPIDKFKGENLVAYDDFCGYIKGNASFSFVFIDK